MSGLPPSEPQWQWDGTAWRQVPPPGWAPPAPPHQRPAPPPQPPRQWGPPPGGYRPPPPPAGWRPTPRTPAASAGARAGARAIDAAVEVVLVVLAFVVGPDDRVFASLFIAVVLIAAYEAAMSTTAGATLGKLAVGLRVVELDRPGGGVGPGNAVRRGLLVGASQVTVVPAVVAIVSMALAPLHRGFHDRATRTLVVRAHTGEVTSAQLVGYERVDEPPVATAQGAAASLGERRRARASRLDDAPLLVVALVAMLAALQVGSVLLVVVASVAWIVLFVIDEAWRISRFGANAGHHRYGLVVVDRATGEPPGFGRSLLRAVVLAPLLYIPPLQSVLALWVTSSAHNRGPHDLAGRTVVVSRATAATQAAPSPAQPPRRY